MKIGVHVGQVVFQGADLQQQWQDHLEQFLLARDVGFDFVSWGHHWLIEPFQHFQPIPVLARFAAEAGSMEMITGVLLTPLLNPVQVAEEVATLDHICEGRFVFGIGLGYRVEECEAAGTQMSERGPRFEEGLELMKRLWTEEEVTHHGRFYRVTGARPTARPYQKPYPRIWIAAMNDPPVKRAGRLGHPFYALGLETFSGLKRHLEVWRATLQEFGHPVPQEVPIVRELYVAETHEEALKKARRCVEEKYKGYAQHGLLTVSDTIAGGVDHLLQDPFVVGTPEESLEKLALFHELGVTHIDVRLFWPAMEQKEVLQMTELVGAKVLPALKKL